MPWKTPPESTEPWLAPYFFIAVGLSIENDESESAPRKDAERVVRSSLTVFGPAVLQPLYRLVVGLPGSLWANPPNTVCQ